VPKKYKKYTPQEINIILELISRNLEYKEIGRQLNRSKNDIANFVHSTSFKKEELAHGFINNRSHIKKNIRKNRKAFNKKIALRAKERLKQKANKPILIEEARINLVSEQKKIGFIQWVSNKIKGVK